MGMNWVRQRWGGSKIVKILATRENDTNKFILCLQRRLRIAPQ